MKDLLISIQSKQIFLHEFEKESKEIIGKELIADINRIVLNGLNELYDCLRSLGVSEDTRIQRNVYMKVKDLVFERISLKNKIDNYEEYDEDLEEEFPGYHDETPSLYLLEMQLDEVDEEILDLLGVQS